MSSEQQNSKRRRVADNQNAVDRQNFHGQAAIQMAIDARMLEQARLDAQARANAKASRDAQAREAQARAAEIQRSVHMNALKMSKGQLTQAQIVPTQLFRVSEPYGGQQRGPGRPYAETSGKVRSQQSTSSVNGGAQSTSKRQTRQSASKTAQGRNISRLPGQIYPVTAKGQTLAQSPKDANNMPMMHRQPVGLDYGGMGGMRTMITQAPIPVNPDVKLKHLPFYDVLGELMKPSSLIPKNNGRMQETLFVFHLTPQQAQDITMSRDFRPGAKVEYTVQVQIRFSLVETTCEQADTFPSQIQVRVNNKPATLPNVIPTNKPNVEPKRPGRPVDITNLCRLSPTVSNAITVSWAADFTRSFCMSIYLVKKLTSDTLLARLRQFGNRHADHTRALIKEKLSQDPDSEIATTSLRVSLMCPLGKMRMQIPCRASTCTHLQCFDSHTYLLMNERKPTWNCPVCDKPCPYDKLIIDGYFVEIFRENPNTNDIVFHEDGSWSPMKPQKESSSNSVNLSTPSAKSSAAAVARSNSPISDFVEEMSSLIIISDSDEPVSAGDSSGDIYIWT